MGNPQGRRAWTWLFLIGGAAALDCGRAWAQAQVPNAPNAPVCAWDDSPAAPAPRRSTCQFKSALSGTPTSVVGNRVILFRRSAKGGHGTSRTYSEESIKRLATRYGFTATVTEDPGIFTAATLANTKVVIMSNGDGDVVPPGANRTALENFQKENGWGVIWIHAACAAITSAWPFGQESCVQQYFHHDPSNTQRRVFVDSGTTASPNQGIRNPQTEFLLRQLPGWAANRTLAQGDEYYCFQAPARNTAGVNVLLGYDRSSGLPIDGGCPNRADAGPTGSGIHNLAWTRSMGKGITIYNSIGHDVGTYTGNQNAGDSLLWRFIRYAAKDWCVSGTEACGTGPISVFRADARPVPDPAVSSNALSLAFRDAGRNAVTVSDVSGKRVYAGTFTGVQRAEIPIRQRGLFFVRVASKQGTDVKTVRIL